MTREEKIEMQYIGVLSFLCEHAVYLADQDEAPETIIQILNDAQTVLPDLRWKRILNRFEIDFQE